MHACVDHYTVCNDFDSKENSVYCYFFQNHANPRDIVSLFWTPILLLKVNDAMVQVKIIMLHEKWMAVFIYIFVIAQSEAKGLELCPNLGQCSVLWFCSTALSQCDEQRVMFWFTWNCPALYSKQFAGLGLKLLYSQSLGAVVAQLASAPLSDRREVSGSIFRDLSVCFDFPLIRVAIALNTRKTEHWQRQGGKGRTICFHWHQSSNWRNYRCYVNKVTFPFCLFFFFRGCRAFHWLVHG